MRDLVLERRARVVHAHTYTRAPLLIPIIFCSKDAPIESNVLVALCIYAWWKPPREEPVFALNECFSRLAIPRRLDEIEIGLLPPYFNWKKG